MYYTDGKRIVEAVKVNLINLTETHELLNNNPYNITNKGIIVYSDGTQFFVSHGDYLLKIDDYFYSCDIDKFKACYRIVSDETLEDKLKQMNHFKQIQENALVSDSGPYMTGLYNGMEFMLAIMEDRETVFKEIKTIDDSIKSDENYYKQESGPIKETKYMDD